METARTFQWQRAPQAEQLITTLLNESRQRNRLLGHLERQFLTQTSTRLLDWVDHLALEETSDIRRTLTTLGFIETEEEELKVFASQGTTLPRIVLLPGESARMRSGVALRVEHVADFLQVHGFAAEIEGTPFSTYRRARIDSGDPDALYIIERRGSQTLLPSHASEIDLQTYLNAVDAWKTTPRARGHDAQAFEALVQIANRLISSLGPNLAAHVVCRCERDYWLSRNRLARLQKSRQDTLGLGWANHDHHTFRSSRRHFSALVQFFTRLGFQARERFYAGQDAGWGAQVMENPQAGIVLFLDVDLTPEELAIDFLNQALPEREELGTIGLWCELHGDSLLQAGMHHLAGRFLFHRLPHDLMQTSPAFMPPFSQFSYLKQAFSIGERWEVNPKKVRMLLETHAIDTQTSEEFLSKGVVGSHLENLERNEGYKGFNQKNVSEIIRDTDPRHYHAA